MVNIFTAFLFTSIVGTLLAFFLALIRPLTQKVFSPGWHYYAWLIVLFVMILPIRFDVSQVEGIIPVTNSSTISHYISESISESQLIDVINEENFTPSKTPIISTFSKPFKILWDKNASTFACIWLIVCLGLFFIRLSCYITFTYIVALSLLIVSLLASGTFAGSILGNVPDDDLTDSEAISNAQQQQIEAVLNVESEFYVSDTLTNSTSNLGNNSEHVPSTNREITSKNTDANVNALTSTSTSGKDVQLDISINTAQGLSNTSFIWPADSKRISNSFGTRVHPITNEVQTHNGVDILAEEGANVYASIKGNVIEAAFDKQDGNYIIIENAHGICTKYSQLSSIDVSVGDSVTQGHIIGKVGKTGKATGAHLHFSIKADGKYYDPIQLAN